MTEFQRFIAELQAKIPLMDEAGRLPGLHDHLLSLSHHFRLHTRWGDYAEYSVAIRNRDVIELTDGKGPILPDGQGRWRIRFGIKKDPDIGFSASIVLEFRQPKRGWEVWGNEAEMANTVWEWLYYHYPVAEALLKIDMRLLQQTSKE